jgi:hypothetical protein
MTRPPRIRATAVASAVSFVALGPPAFAAAPTDVPGPSSWQPPAVDMNMLATLPAESPNGTPDAVFSRSGSCIVSGVGDVPLVDRPPVQDMLAIDQAQTVDNGKKVEIQGIGTVIGIALLLGTLFVVRTVRRDRVRRGV